MLINRRHSAAVIAIPKHFRSVFLAALVTIAPSRCYHMVCAILKAFAHIITIGPSLEIELIL